MKVRFMENLWWMALAVVLLFTLAMDSAGSQDGRDGKGAVRSTDAVSASGEARPGTQKASSVPLLADNQSPQAGIPRDGAGQPDGIQAARTELERAREAQKRSANWPADAELLREMAESNVEMARQLLDARRKEQQELIRTERQEQKLADLRNNFQATRKRIERMGLTPTSGEVLQMLRGVVGAYRPDIGKIGQRRRLLIQLTQQEKSLLREQYDFSKLRDEFFSEETPGQLTFRKGSGHETLPADLLPEATSLFQIHKSLLEDLIRANEQRRDELNRRILTTSTMKEVHGEFRNYILDKLFWTRTTSVYDSGDDTKPNDLERGRNALGWLFNPDKWSAIQADWMRSFRQKPFPWVVGLLLLVLMWTGRSRIDRQVKQLNDRVGKVQSDSVFVTVQALFLITIRRAGFPILLLLGAIQLGDAPTVTLFTRCFTSGLYVTASIWFLVALTVEMFRDGGVGRIHFHWGESACRALNRGNLVLLFCFILFFFLGVMIQRGVQGEGYQASLGRLLFCLAMLPLSGLFLRLFREGRPWQQEIRDRIRGSWLERYEKVLSRALLLIPPTLLVLTVAGYGYTPFVLSSNLFETALLFLALSTLHATLLRWINTGRKRLAYQKAEEERKAARLQAAQLAESAAGEDELKDIIPTEPEEDAVDVEAVSEQTTLLIRSISGVLYFVFLWLIWGEVLQAFRVLDSVSLYTTQVGVGADGTPEIKTISLVNVLLSLLIFAATVVLARTVPAFMQIVNFKRFARDPGSRLAFGQIGRYIILAVGVGLTFSQVGIGWSKFSVVAAAMTLGLSWGLQDIFSNFVSGIILLLERPVRVGDIVTVSGVSGKIARIQIRATTITNWDRQELIVPNKAFLSEKVTNWSLSDEITRVVIQVGISYNNNPKQAQELLLKIAGENPLVRKDPGPSVLFSGFGADSLDFALRVFVGLSDMTAVQNQLRMSIQEEFAKAGLEIPFAQRDVHLDTPGPLEVRLIEKT